MTSDGRREGRTWISSWTLKIRDFVSGPVQAIRKKNKSRLRRADWGGQSNSEWLRLSALSRSCVTANLPVRPMPTTRDSFPSTADEPRGSHPVATACEAGTRRLSLPLPRSKSSSAVPSGQSCGPQPSAVCCHFASVLGLPQVSGSAARAKLASFIVLQSKDCRAVDGARRRPSGRRNPGQHRSPERPHRAWNTRHRDRVRKSVREMGNFAHHLICATGPFEK